MLFEGARLITFDGSAPIEDSAFLVENQKITRVGKRGALQSPAGAVHMDLSGKTVMPAKIDLHGTSGTSTGTSEARAAMDDQPNARRGAAPHLQTGRHDPHVCSRQRYRDRNDNEPGLTSKSSAL
jgi:imidazolonepropionase-like amidohydrolase